MTLIRVFVSIPVPGSGLDGLMDALRRCDGVKVSPGSQVHITLRFIGDVDEKKVPRITDALKDACAGLDPFEIVVRDVGAFPNQKRPSVVWVGAQPEDVLRGIADRLSENLRKANVRFDEKPFKSHITIGRCRGPSDLEGFFGEFSGEEFLRYRCDRVLVMRSVLGPSGAKHTVLDTIMLG